MTQKSETSHRNPVIGMVIALVASLLVTTSPSLFQQPATGVGGTTYNDLVCDLGDPNDHSTSATAFEISDEDELWEITDCVSSTTTIYFKLTNDIVIPGGVFVGANTGKPIGYRSSDYISFSGVLDGQNFEISGLSMSSSDHGVGLFAYLHNATISNLVISGTADTAADSYDEDDSAGALAIRSRGNLHLSSISNQADVSGVAYVGGLIGYVENDVTIIDSSNLGEITAEDFVGGLVGYVDGDTNIAHSYNTGTISGVIAVGGLVGSNANEANISHSYNTGAISGSEDSIGGLMGEADTANINHSYNTGAVTGAESVAGLVGYVDEDTNITSSYNTGPVSGSAYVGGLLGNADEANAIINSSHNTGTVSATGNFVGGLLGSVDEGDASVSYSYNTGPVSGSADVGGLVGFVEEGNAIINSSHNTGTVSATGNFVGGLLGSVDVGDASVSYSYNTGAVTGAENVAGLVGYVDGDTNIHSSHNTGGISAEEFVGGLAGYVDGDTNITSSYNTGAVSGSGNVGGLAGYVSDDSNLDSSYNTGTVSGTSDNVGGLAGYVDGDANITSSYNTGAVTGAENVAGLVGYVDLDTNINSSHNTGGISAEEFVGGLVGDVEADANINSSYNTGTVSGTSDNVGGLAGYVTDTANIKQSYNTGAVSGSGDVGGLVGDVEYANITSSFNTGAITSTGNDVGGLLGHVDRDTNIHSSYNTGTISGLDDIGGLVGEVNEGNLNISTSYNAGAISGTTDVDGLAGTVSGSVTVTSAYSSVDSDHAASSAVADMKKASTYVGFNFTNTWGFGTCSDNQGFPMLRQLSPGMTLFAISCGVNSLPSANPTPTPPPAYAGPVVVSPKSVMAGEQVTFVGRRLNSVTAAHVKGVKLTIIEVTEKSLVLEVTGSTPVGTHDLILQSSRGTLTFQNGITVLGPETQIVAEATPEAEEIQKLTVGSFRGFIAIYTKGYEGQRLSAKVAGKWLVVESLDESFKGNDYSRTVRRTGSGFSIKVHLYIDREFVRTEELVTAR